MAATPMRAEPSSGAEPRSRSPHVYALLTLGLLLDLLRTHGMVAKRRARTRSGNLDSPREGPILCALPEAPSAFLRDPNRTNPDMTYDTRTKQATCELMYVCECQPRCSLSPAAQYAPHVWRPWLRMRWPSMRGQKDSYAPRPMKHGRCVAKYQGQARACNERACERRHRAITLQAPARDAPIISHARPGEHRFASAAPPALHFFWPCGMRAHPGAASPICRPP